VGHFGVIAHPKEMTGRASERMQDRLRNQRLHQLLLAGLFGE
jgi:hypothetical protein